MPRREILDRIQKDIPRGVPGDTLGGGISGTSARLSPARMMSAAGVVNSPGCLRTSSVLPRLSPCSPGSLRRLRASGGGDLLSRPR